MYDIIGIDTPWFDEVICLDEMPAENRNAEIKLRSCQGGGKVSTALCAAGRLGAKTAIAAVLGTDATGRFLEDDFERHNVAKNCILIKEGYSAGRSVVISDKASMGRRILWEYRCERDNLTVEDIKRVTSFLENTKFLHICRLGPVEIAAAKICRAAGGKVCLDADFFTGEISANLDLVDIFIGSEEFAADMFGKNENISAYLKEIRKKGPKTAIFTLGKNGCAGMWAEGEFVLPAFTKNIQVRDTVGAGDVFHGAYLFAAARGDIPPKAAEFASAVSAIKCTRIGGRAAIPSLAVTEEYIKTGMIDYIEIDKRVSFYEKLM